MRVGICSSRKSKHWPLPPVVLLSLRNSHCDTLEGFSCAWKSEHPCRGVLQPCSDEDAPGREAGAPARCARAPKGQVPVAGRQTGSRERGSGHTLPGSWRGASRGLRPRKATAGLTQRAPPRPGSEWTRQRGASWAQDSGLQRAPGAAARSRDARGRAPRRPCRAAGVGRGGGDKVGAVWGVGLPPTSPTSAPRPPSAL